MKGEERRGWKGEEARTGGEVGQTEEGNLEWENVRKDGFGFTCSCGQERQHQI